ncbi:MAG: DNA cytosine methyltransferase [Planctomycetaceae bacterium]|nr:DNA cytosine methyltransferase [Planctomycetaceae bacterium]
MKVLQKRFWFNEPHDYPLPQHEIIVDGFAGGGGASVGLEAAFGRNVDVAINHNPAAIAMHMANHPQTKHYCENIWDVDPLEVTEGRPVKAAWFSPDCTHFSKARGEKPVKKNIRGLAWVVVKWVELTNPESFFVENVEEFQTWGPVDRKTNQPIKEKAGVTFQLWLWKLRELGYNVEYRVLRACDYGTPTTRKRLFIIGRRDGKKINWPAPTHGSPETIRKELKQNRRSNLRPWRTAAEIIDWSIPCPSIFLTPEEAKAQGCRRPLAEKTLARIAEGIRRYVIESQNPFIVRVNHGGDHYRGQSVDAPLGTITQKNGYGVVTPYLLQLQQGGKTNRIDEPHRTITASRKDCNLIVTPCISRMFGQGVGTPVDQPLGTVTSENKSALVSAFLVKHFGGVVGVPASTPFPTITTVGTQNQIVTATMVQTGYGERNGQSPRCLDIQKPLGTVVAGACKFAEVRAFLMKYYGSGTNSHSVDRPLSTITTKDRLCLGIVVIAGEPYQIVDIGMRMLTPRELFRAQGFPDEYEIMTGINGKPATKSEQVARCGNSVCPQVVEAIVRANT